ncbi:MAG: rhodanese-like domain-containing protein [Bdellovibrio bacteriovorus]
MISLKPRELAELLAAPEASTQDRPLLLDVREPWELAICRIEGSQSIPMQRIPQALKELDRVRPIVCICHHGIRSYQVARFLEHQGFNRVINLEGGVAAWAREVDPAMATY